MFYKLIRNRYLIYFICVSLTGGFFYAFPISLTQRIVDELSGGGSTTVFVYCTIGYMLCRGLGCLFDYLGAILSKHLSNRLLVDLRRSFLENLYRRAPQTVYSERFERIFSLFSSDIDTVAGGVSGPLLWFCSSVSLFLWSSTTLVVIRPELAAIYVAAAILIALNTVASGKRIKKNQLKTKKVEEKRISHAKLIIDQYMKLLIMNQDAAMIRMNSEIDREVTELSLRDTKIASQKTLLNDNIYYLSGALVWLLGGFLVLAGNMTVGEITAFISFAGLIISPIVRFSSQWVALQKMRVSLQRIKEFQNNADADWGDESAEGLCGALRFEKVNFSYSPDKPLIVDFSADFRADRVYCLAGANGSGKSTVFRLLTRLLDSYTGNIFYAGKNIRTFTKESLYGLIGYENEVPVIVNGTLYDNLIFSIPEADPSVVEELYVASGLSAMLGAPLDLAVESGEKQFSRGQMQLIGIVRMLLSGKKILIFDETFSGIADDAVARVMKLLREYCRVNFAIVIFVSHNKDHQNMAEETIFVDTER